LFLWYATKHTISGTRLIRCEIAKHHVFKDSITPDLVVAVSIMVANTSISGLFGSCQRIEGELKVILRLCLVLCDYSSRRFSCEDGLRIA